MTNNEDKLVDYLRWVTADLTEAKQRLREVEDRSREPIAIVGMSCRFPGGVHTPEDLWRLTLDEGDAIGSFPDDRNWDVPGLFDPEPGRPGKSYVREGGFLDDAGGFDAGFFGIAPREATATDPQQRLLLETAWEALEHARIDPTALRGSQAGVFVGNNGQDHVLGLSAAPPEYAQHSITGATGSVLAGRVSYALGFEGPAAVVDTACSSSLVALHFAAGALRRQECPIALVGGITVMTTPTLFVGFSQQRGLSASARCRAFSDDADGTSMSEGVGWLVVERLSDAQRLGHRVLAVVRGSAVNQDGASNGLTAPSGPAQRRVIGRALADAGLSGSDVDVVEAHGTGTRLGDPIEAEALIAAYGRDRTGGPLLLGSVKSNLGHTQAAAGIAGVIKVVESIRHGIVPKTLHIKEPTTQVDWSAGTVRLLTERTDWPDTGRPRRAGVSSFGASGTNTHVIIEQAPPVEEVAGEPAPAPPVIAWPLMAKSDQAIRDQAVRLLDAVRADPALSPADVGYSLATTRAAFTCRAVVVGTTRDELLSGLRATADGQDSAFAVTGRAGGRLAVMFTGQGSQRAGMGHELYETFPVFTQAFDDTCALLKPGLREEVFGSGAGLELTGWAQPALFAFQIALYRLVESWGVRPDVVGGHSVGEIAAAHVAGVLSLADACALVTARADLMQALPPGGAMVAVGASEAEVRELVAERPSVAIAAVNGPDAVVVSGAEADVLAVAEVLAGRGRRTKRLRVSHAFHSPLMEPMLSGFRAALSGLDFHEPRIPVLSLVSGDCAAPVHTPDYWVGHVRATVRFAGCDEALGAEDVTTVLELGPDAVLTGMGHESLSWVPSVRANRAEPLAVVQAVAGVGVRGADIGWVALFPGARTVDLPTYAFQHERHWLPAAAAPLPDPADAGFWAAVEAGDLTEVVPDEDSRRSIEAALPALAGWRRRARDLSTVHDWRYGTTWKPRPDPAGTPELRGDWLLVVPASHAGEEWVRGIAAGLTESGADVEPFEVDTADDRAALAARLTGSGPGSGRRGVVSLLAVAESTGLSSTLALVQALGDAGVPAPLWCLTRDAVFDGTADPEQAAVWGLGRVAALEQPHRWGGLVDLPAVLDPLVTARLAAVLSGRGADDQVAVRDSGLYARRLTRRTGRPTAGSVPDTTPASDHGTVLVTGGTGALGAHTARWLAGRGTRNLLLLSRAGEAAPEAAGLVAELTALGASATIASCDVADHDALAAVLAEVPADRPVTAVYHTAGALHTTPLADTTPDLLAEVFAGKACGARNLDRLLGDTVGTFVLFSSVSGIWGSTGHAAYAAANAYLDALAEARRARGAAGTSVAWGPWAEGGMGAGPDVDRQAARHGLPAMGTDAALAALRQALELDETAVTVAQVDWARFLPLFTSGRTSALFEDLDGTRPASPAPQGGAPEWVRLLDDLPVADRPIELRRLVRREVARILGYDDGQAVDVDQAFRDLGFDSLSAVELRDSLTARTGLALPAGLVFDHPSTAALTDHLYGELGQGTDDPTATVLSRLAQLEAELAGLDGVDGMREAVEPRLRVLLGRFCGGSTGENGQAVADRLETASVDDLFAFVDQEFGQDSSRSPAG